MLPKMRQDFNVTINKICLPVGDMGLWSQDPDFRTQENCLIFICMVIRQIFLERSSEYPHVKQDLSGPEAGPSRVIQTTSSVLVTGFLSPGPPRLSICHVASKEKRSNGLGITRISLCLPRSIRKVRQKVDHDKPKQRTWESGSRGNGRCFREEQVQMLRINNDPSPMPQIPQEGHHKHIVPSAYTDPDPLAHEGLLCHCTQLLSSCKSGV